MAMGDLCLHRGGEGTSPWEENGDRNSQPSMASLLKPQSVQSEITKLSTNTLLVMSLELTPKAKSSKEMLLLCRNVFSHHLEIPGMFVPNLFGSRCPDFDPQQTAFLDFGISATHLNCSLKISASATLS